MTLNRLPINLFTKCKYLRFVNMVPTNDEEEKIIVNALYFKWVKSYHGNILGVAIMLDKLEQ